MRLFGLELVAHERGHARLDAARPQRDQAQARGEAEHFSMHIGREPAAREHAVAEAIDQRNPKYRVIPSDQLVGKPRAQQRHEIIRRHKHVDDFGRMVLVLAQSASDKAA